MLRSPPMARFGRGLLDVRARRVPPRTRKKARRARVVVVEETTGDGEDSAESGGKGDATDIAHAVFPGEPYFMLALTNAWMGMPGRELDKDICMKVSDLNLPVPLTAR